MPSIDSLMQEWPSDFEESLKENCAPNSKIDLSVEVKTTLQTSEDENYTRNE
jgi:hypothetical protein